MKSALKATNSVTGTVMPLHDSPSDEVASRKAALEAELAALEAEQQQFKAEEAERLREQRESVERRIQGLRGDARNLRQKALTAKSKGLVADEKLFADAAIDKDWEANHLANEWEIEEAAVAYEQAQTQETDSKGVLITVAKIALTLIVCGLAVLYSGDWIDAKYPGAAIYNEVSFQKIVFGFSVFITGFVCVIMGMNAFFPGFGKYLNPFNKHGLDFYEDFKQLNEWQRNIISLALFAVLFLGFLWIATGKLD